MVPLYLRYLSLYLRLAFSCFSSVLTLIHVSVYDYELDWFGAACLCSAPFSPLTVTHESPLAMHALRFSRLHPATSNLVLHSFCFKVLYFITFIERKHSYKGAELQKWKKLKQELRMEECSMGV